ncbi:MAG: hypothetical protein SFY32_17500 [Bacteroidota bacterium]|nr:hypothetical protein [Bacteroidota bacterium]
MQHLLVSVSDSANLAAIKLSLLKTKGIERVDTIEEKSTEAAADDWKNRLHLPGPPLTDAQLEELAEDMEKETVFYTMEEAKIIGEKLIDKWYKKSR